MNKFFKGLLIIASVVILLFACRKSDRDRDNSIIVTQDVLFAEKIYDDLFKQVHTLVIYDSLKGDSASLAELDNCIDTFTLSTGIGNSFPKILIIDYGTDGTACSDGKVRKGKIQVVFRDNYLVAGAKDTITPIGYSVDGTKISGQRVLVSKGKNSSGIYSFEFIDNKGTITNDTANIAWSGSKTCQWTIGSTSSNISDDSFNITKLGYSGSTTEGTLYTVEILTDVNYKLSCNWKDQGKIRVRPNNLSPRDIDYGTGNCEGDVSVYLNGVIKPYTIP